MNTYFVTMTDDLAYGEVEVIQAASTEDAARDFIANHYMEDDYGDSVVVYEPKVNTTKYTINEPELVLTKG